MVVADCAACFLCGGPVRNRTAALSVMSQPLYLLSHRPVLPAPASVSHPSLADDILGAYRSGWQRKPESNRRIRGPKSRALPLGDSSMKEGRRSTTALGCFYIMVDQLCSPVLQHIGCAFLQTSSGSLLQVSHAYWNFPSSSGPPLKGERNEQAGPPTPGAGNGS